MAATRAMPNYNVMGVAKAALEASVRYLAVDFGSAGIRVNAISAGPIRTLAGAGIADARQMFSFQQRHSPLRRGVTLDEIGGAALYLLSDLSTGVTGDIHFVDSGYNIIAMPHPSALTNGNEAEHRTASTRPSRTRRSNGRSNAMRDIWVRKSHLKFVTGLLALALLAAILIVNRMG